MKIHRLEKRKIEIDINSFEQFLLMIKKDDSTVEESISQIWNSVIKKNTIQNNVTKLNTTELINIYSSYFQNGLSDGACAGARMKSIFIRFKYLMREPKRLKIVKKLLEHQFSNDFMLNNLPLSSNVFSGEIWMSKYKDIDIPLEICDHLYFFLKFYNELKTLIAEGNTLVFIGDGSGFLSNLILNSFQVKNAIFIDLPQFLIRQYIVNFEFKHKCKYHIPSQVEEINKDKYILINQDSFPEIPLNDIKKYISKDLLLPGSKLFSYNQKPKDNSHIRWDEILKMNSFNLSFEEESKTRSNYFLEIYEC